MVDLEAESCPFQLSARGAPESLDRAAPSRAPAEAGRELLPASEAVPLKAVLDFAAIRKNGEGLLSAAGKLGLICGVRHWFSSTGRVGLMEGYCNKLLQQSTGKMQHYVARRNAACFNTAIPLMLGFSRGGPNRLGGGLAPRRW